MLVPAAVWLALVNPCAADDSGARDCLITVRVRQALQQEPALAPLNLGVSIRQGVVTLYGSVPSNAIARLAREKVGKVQGVLEVRSELEIRPPDDPLSELLQTPSKALEPLPDFLAHERYPAPGWLTSRWGDGEPSVPASPGVSLMPPVKMPAPPAVATQPTDLVQAVDRLRMADRRFHRLRVNVQGGTVRLAGTVERREDLMAFAQQVSRLPGVSRVILQEVRTPNEP